MYSINFLKQNLPDLVLKYRKNVFIPYNGTYGLEIEFVNGSYEKVEKQIKSLDNKWFIYRDSSVHDFSHGNSKGGEVCSSTIDDKIDIWKDLKDVCNIIKDAGGLINERPAGHIHIGSQAFQNKNAFNNFMLIWAAFEDVINKYMAGEFLNPKDNNLLAINCRNEFLRANFDLDKLKSIRDKTCIPAKTYDVSLFYFMGFYRQHYNTIEFRKIRGSLEENVWQNNINFLFHLIEYSKNVSSEELNYIRKNFIDNNEFLTDEKIKSDKAMLLADFIFKDEIDKLYFLKQYFKDFNYSDDINAKFVLTKKKNY